MSASPDVPSLQRRRFPGTNAVALSAAGIAVLGGAEPFAARAPGDLENDLAIANVAVGLEYEGVSAYAIALKSGFDRKAGSAKGYVYSKALRSTKIVWRESTLDRWLRNPEATAPGQKTGFSVSEPQDRADRIADLENLRLP